MMDDKINDKIRLIFKIIILLFIYYYFIIYLLLFYLCKINSVKQNINIIRNINRKSLILH